MGPGSPGMAAGARPTDPGSRDRMTAAGSARPSAAALRDAVLPGDRERTARQVPFLGNATAPCHRSTAVPLYRNTAIPPRRNTTVIAAKAGIQFPYSPLISQAFLDPGFRRDDVAEAEPFRPQPAPTPLSVEQPQPSCRGGPGSSARADAPTVPDPPGHSRRSGFRAAPAAGPDPCAARPMARPLPGERSTAAGQPPETRKICGRMALSSAISGVAKGRSRAFQIPTSASARRSMRASSWKGVGVMRRRSVPRGTVG